MRVVSDVTPYIDEIFPLYQAVYARSDIHFEKLTPEYFCQVGRKMPEKALFFLWLKEGRIVCFNMCLNQTPYSPAQNISVSTIRSHSTFTFTISPYGT